MEKDKVFDGEHFEVEVLVFLGVNER